MEPKTVYASLEKKDLEELIKAWNEKLVVLTDRWRNEETAKMAYDDEVRPIAKRLAKFVELWEELDAKERAADELTAARMARNGA